MADETVVPDSFKTLFVTNLADDEDAIRAFFQEVGTILGLRLLNKKEDQETRAGVITMSSNAEARAAIQQLGGQEMEGTGKRVRLRWDPRSLERATGGGGQRSAFGTSFGDFGGSGGGGEFCRNKEPPMMASFGEEETISLNGRDLTAIKSTISGQPTVIGYLYRDLAPVAGSPSAVVTEHVSADKSPLKGFGKASENAPNGETVLGRRASVRGESGAESRGPECQLQSSTLLQNGHREPAPGERDLGDIMPSVRSNVSATQDVQRTPALGEVASRTSYFNRRTIIDVVGSRSNPTSEAPRDVVKVIADVNQPGQPSTRPALIPEIPKHARISAPETNGDSSALTTLAKMRARRSSSLRAEAAGTTAPSANVEAPVPLVLSLKSFTEGSLLDLNLNQVAVQDATVSVEVRHVFADCTVAVWSTGKDRHCPATGIVKKLSEEMRDFYGSGRYLANLGVPTENQPVAAVIKSIWYRAKWLSKPSDGASSVYLVDIGEEHDVLDLDLRILDQRFGSEPAAAVIVRVWGLTLKPSAIVREDLIAILMKPGQEITHAKVHMVAASLAPELQFLIGDLEPFWSIPVLLVKKKLEREGRPSKLGNVLFADSAHHIFLLDDANKLAIEDIQAKVFQAVEKEPTKPANLKEGAVNAVIFSEDGGYYRGYIADIVGDKYHVEFIDFGNTDFCTADAIIGLSKEVVDMELVSDVAFLSGVTKDKALDPVLLAEIKTLQDRPCVYEIISTTENGDLEVRLWNELGEEIGAATAVAAPSNTLPYPFMFEDMKYKVDYQVGQEIPVYTSYVTDPELVFLSAGKDIVIDPMLQELLEDLNERCEVAPMLTVMPPSGAVICAKYEGDWYRAVITTRYSETKAHIHYVDYGNEETVELHMVREMTKPWMKVPKMVIHAGILGMAPPDGAGVYSDEARIKAEGFLINKVGNFKVAGFENSLVLGELTLDDGRQSVVDLFVSEGIAVRAEN